MTDKSTTSLSIAIVCYHSTADELIALVDSLTRASRQLRQQFDLPTITVYLIDNSEPNKWTLDIFKSQRESLHDAQLDIRLLNGHGNVGYGSGHNLVIKELATEFHLLLNPDIVLDEASLSEGLRYLRNNPDVSMVSPYAVGDDGNKQYLCKNYPALMTFFVRGFLPRAMRHLFTDRLSKFEMHHLPETAPSVNVPIISGCFMLCRTRLLKQLGGFDEKYFLYFEDFDLSLRMGKIGKNAYLPTMKIRHSGGHAARKGLRHLLMFIRSGLRFFGAHGWRLFRQA